MNIDVKSKSPVKPCWSPVMTAGDEENSSVGVIRPGDRVLGGDGELWYGSYEGGELESIVIFPVDGCALPDAVRASDDMATDCGCSINGLVIGAG